MSGDRLLPRTTAHPVAQEDGPAPDLTAATNSRPSWERRLALWIGIADASAVLAATAVSVLLRIVLVDSGIGGMRAAADVAALTAGWVVCLHISDAYGAHVLGAGAEEYKRVLTASWRFAAVLAVGSYAFRYQLSRGFLLCPPERPRWWPYAPGGTATCAACTRAASPSAGCSSSGLHTLPRT
jgi:hypothetical protein